MQEEGADAEPLVLCIVRDMTNPECITKETFNLPAKTSVKQMLSYVAKRLSYVEDTFNLGYERHLDGSIDEVCFNKKLLMVTAFMFS